MATDLFAYLSNKHGKNNGPIATFCNNQGEIEVEEDEDDKSVQ